MLLRRALQPQKHKCWGIVQTVESEPDLPAGAAEAEDQHLHEKEFRDHFVTSFFLLSFDPHFQRILKFLGILRIISRAKIGQERDHNSPTFHRGRNQAVALLRGRSPYRSWRPGRALERKQRLTLLRLIS